MGLYGSQILTQGLQFSSGPGPGGEVMDPLQIRFFGARILSDVVAKLFGDKV